MPPALGLALLLNVVLVPVAIGDALADCNEAIDPMVRIAGCSEIIDADPPSDVLAVALMNRAIGRAATSDFETALADLDAALKAEPGMPAALYNRGNVNLDLGRTVAAIDDFNAVIEAAPDFALGWLNRGLAREKAREFVGAREDYRRALALDKSLEPARRGLARLRRAK
jgi:tetratricopeptide (TPR) repeat protein